MDLFSSIDLYCERTQPGYWNEPFNAISNVAFLIAALYARRQRKARGGGDHFEVILIVLAGLIGIGSFLFHIFANGWSELADVIPIWSFVALYVLLSIYRSTQENLARTLRIVFIVSFSIGTVFWFTSGDITTGASTPVDRFNGSLQYFPALASLLIFAVITHVRKLAVRTYISGAAIVFFVSLVFRTIDLQTCQTTIIGTHFLWHLLNAMMVGLLLLALIKYMPPRAR